jgi:outer membrane protein
MKKIKLLIAFTLVLSQFAFAQEVDPDLKALIQKSFTYFPRLKELQQQIDISTLREDVARSGYRPLITGNASYSYLNPVSIITIPTGPSTFNEIQTQPYSNQNVNVALNQTLYDFGRTRQSIEKSKYDILIAQDNLELNKVTLASQIASTYFTIIYFEQSIIVQDSVISYFNKYKKLIDSRVKRGDALEFDALTAQSNIDQASNRKVDLQNQLQRQYNILNFAIGENLTRFTGKQLLDFPMGNLPADSLMSIARVNNKELQLNKTRILSQEADVALSKNNLLPTLNLNGAVGFRNGYQPDIFQTRFNYLIGAGLVIPIYSGNRTRDQIKISQSSLMASRYAASTAEITVKRDIDQALADVQASSERLRNIESQITQASRALELANSRFRNGAITYIELLNSQTNLQQAYLFKLQYAHQLTLGKVELARLMGIVYW